MRSSCVGGWSAFVLLFLVGCTTTETETAWIVSGVALAPEQGYVERLIADCRRSPTKACRDRTVDACKGHIDGVYYGAKAGFVVGADRDSDERWWTTVPVLNLVFATASSRESTANKVADMSAASALLNGIRTIFRRPDDKDKLLEDKDVLVAQMEEDRTQIWQLIAINSSRSIEEYTLEQVLSDLGRYRAAGTPAQARVRLASLLGI